MEFADRRDTSLAAWIESNGRFPNTMVDRITLRRAPRRLPISARHGIDDGWPVLRNVQAMGDRRRLRAGRPQWERVGASSSPTQRLEFMKLHC
jgi:mannitol-1-phosphate/altronate dehydrogenase